MKVKYSAVNAFTSLPDAGNPAAIVILDASNDDVSDGSDIKPLFPADATLQAIATAIDYPMTAFLVPLPGTSGQAASAGETDRYALRWFNPAHEVWICGHATMALSHYLVNELYPKPKRTADSSDVASQGRPAEKAKLNLLTVKYGTVSSIQVIDPWGPGYLTAIDFPQLTTFDELSVKEGRGKELWEVIEAASQGIGKEDVLDIREDEQRVLVELRSGVDLGGAHIDCTKFDGIAPKYVILFQIAPSSPAGAYAKGAPHVHSRCFGSGDFAVEDSATGSAHCAVIPYILSSPSASTRLLQTHPAESFGLDPDMRRIVRVKQLSERGGEMAVCWNQEAGTVRIMGECCSLGDKEANVEVQA